MSSISSLARIEVILEAAGSSPHPRQPNPRAIHAALHRLVEEHDRAFARYLHDAMPKPIAMAITDDGEEGDGRRVAVQLGLLTGETIRACGGALLGAKASGTRLELDHVPYVVHTVRPKPVGTLPFTLTYPDLIARGEPARSVRLAFVTPTTMRNDSRSFRSIEPRHVFGSGFVQRWRAFAGETPDVLTDEETLGAIELVDGAMRERKIDLGKFGANAFTGWAEYRAPDGHASMKTLAVLATFACFAGVGSRTAYGLGGVSREA